MALLIPEFTQRERCETVWVSDWKQGSLGRALIPYGRIADTGEVKFSDPPRKRVLSGRNAFNAELKGEAPSTLAYEITPLTAQSNLSAPLRSSARTQS